MDCRDKKTACGPLSSISYRKVPTVGVISPARAVIRGTPSPRLFNSCVWFSTRLMPQMQAQHKGAAFNIFFL